MHTAVCSVSYQRVYIIFASSVYTSKHRCNFADIRLVDKVTVLLFLCKRLTQFPLFCVPQNALFTIFSALQLQNNNLVKFLFSFAPLQLSSQKSLLDRKILKGHLLLCTPSFVNAIKPDNNETEVSVKLHTASLLPYSGRMPVTIGINCEMHFAYSHRLWLYTPCNVQGVS
jgi:hypothetical protein